MRIDLTSPTPRESQHPLTIVTDDWVIDVFPSGTVQRYVRRQDGILTGEAYEYQPNGTVARLG